MSEAGNAIKKRLLAEGKNPRSYVHSMGDFLLRWLDTADDDSFINVASCYLNRERNKTAKLEIVALDPAKITEASFFINLCQCDNVRDPSATASL